MMLRAGECIYVNKNEAIITNNPSNYRIDCNLLNKDEYCFTCDFADYNCDLFYDIRLDVDCSWTGVSKT